MYENFRFLILKMDSLIKRITKHAVCFSVWTVKDLFTDPLMERGKAKKIARIKNDFSNSYSSHLNPVQMLQLRLKEIHLEHPHSNQLMMRYFQHNLDPLQTSTFLFLLSKPGQNFILIQSLQKKTVDSKYMNIFRTTMSTQGRRNGLQKYGHYLCIFAFF